MKKVLFVISALVLLSVFLWYFTFEKQEEYRTDVAELGVSPEWRKLGDQTSLLKGAEFNYLLDRYYVVGAIWEEYFSFDGEGALSVRTAEGSQQYLFKEVGSSSSLSHRYWRSKDELKVAESKKELPLSGVRIALDPGHIGGKCAKMEERWFQIGENLPVMEGEMTLLVAQLIKPQLEALGADVSLTRDKNEPVGIQRSPHFLALAESKVNALGRKPVMVERYADKLFYRTAEIRARARKVNEEIKPDLVVALHFNANAWGDPANPSLSDANHFHILLNGAYTRGELEHEDERFELTRRILQGTIKEEIALSKSFVEAFKEETQLPPYHYERNSTRALQVDEEGYVWTRNLLANRLYECPTIFLEPYIMNSNEVHARIQLGDYEGKREVGGQMRKSLFREYADAVVGALEAYYR